MKNDLYDSSQIEQWGIDAVGVALSHTDTLCRYFKENDKTPLRDGSVIIYKREFGIKSYPELTLIVFSYNDCIKINFLYLH